MSNYQIFCVLANFLSKSGNSGHSAGLLTYLAVALCTGYLPLCNAAASRRRKPPPVVPRWGNVPPPAPPFFRFFVSNLIGFRRDVTVNSETALPSSWLSDSTPKVHNVLKSKWIKRIKPQFLSFFVLIGISSVFEETSQQKLLVQHCWPETTTNYRCRVRYFTLARPSANLLSTYN